MNSKITNTLRSEPAKPGSQQRVVSLPRYEGTYPKKWAECDDCGHVNLQPKAYPLKMSSCKTCGSIHIRLYKPKREANI